MVDVKWRLTVRLGSRFMATVVIGFVLLGCSFWLAWKVSVVGVFVVRNARLYRTNRIKLYFIYYYNNLNISLFFLCLSLIVIDTIFTIFNVLVAL